jgi:uncharacterized membrane protein
VEVTKVNRPTRLTMILTLSMLLVLVGGYQMVTEVLSESRFLAAYTMTVAGSIGIITTIHAMTLPERKHPG